MTVLLGLLRFFFCFFFFFWKIHDLFIFGRWLKAHKIFGCVLNVSLRMKWIRNYELMSYPTVCVHAFYHFVMKMDQHFYYLAIYVVNDIWFASFIFIKFAHTITVCECLNSFANDFIYLYLFREVHFKDNTSKTKKQKKIKFVNGQKLARKR